MKRSVVAYVLCAAAMVFLGRFELHTDDTGVEVGLLLSLPFLLGCLHLRNAWQWGLLVGSSVPLAHVFSGTGSPLDFRVVLFVIAVATIGSYAGVAARKAIRFAGRPVDGQFR
jgi:hypothetical protein